MRWVSTAAVLLGAAAAACGSNNDESSGSAGGGGWDGAPPPEAYLEPERYDCTASGPIEPPKRPHALDCYADASCSSPLVAGHRMANPFAPENSPSALRAAILLGVDIVETDVRMTADGHVVLIHDAEVDRTLEGTGKVNELSLADIQAMPMKVAPGEPAGDFSCDRTLTLDEVFDASRGRVVVELEVKDTEAGVASAEYLRDNDLFGEAFLLCDRGECEAARAAVPDVPIMSRPQSAAEVSEETSYAPPPVLVHIDAFFLDPEVDAAIHDVGAKVYANAFTNADIQSISGDYSAYVQVFDDGIQVLQTEFPQRALTGLGRLEPAPP
jgi:glycerophosphoryl diester phosphodiesterase